MTTPLIDLTPAVTPEQTDALPRDGSYVAPCYLCGYSSHIVLFVGRGMDCKYFCAGCAPRVDRHKDDGASVEEPRRINFREFL